MLGLSICNTSTPWAEGTGSFYVTGDSKLYLITARHVVFKPDTAINNTYKYKVLSQTRVNAASFTGNAIDLGTQIEIGELTRLMFPNPQNCHRFKYPAKDRLFKVRGIVPDDEMRQPTISDQNSDPCLVVMKCCNTTGLTIGHANDILSYVCNYSDNGDTRTSKEWAIFSYDHRSGAFSDSSDSGSGIVDDAAHANTKQASLGIQHRAWTHKNKVTLPTCPKPTTPVPQALHHACTQADNITR